MKMADVMTAVCDHYSVSVDDIRGEKRTAQLVIPRQAFCFLAREMVARSSLPSIGRFVHRDHTTVLSSINRIGVLCDDAPEVASDIREIRKRLTRGVIILRSDLRPRHKRQSNNANRYAKMV